jgi:hypothetical protein
MIPRKLISLWHKLRGSKDPPPIVSARPFRPTPMHPGEPKASEAPDLTSLDAIWRPVASAGSPRRVQNMDRVFAPGSDGLEIVPQSDPLAENLSKADLAFSRSTESPTLKLAAKLGDGKQIDQASQAASARPATEPDPHSDSAPVRAAASR